MPEPKKWKAGIADEAWKVMICARDASHAEEALQQLVYILTDAGSDAARGHALLRQMTGEQIVQGLLNYRQKSIDSVRRALKHGEAA